MKAFHIALTALAILIPLQASGAEYRGLTEPHRVVKVGSPAEGVLEKISVERGDIVKKGQVIAQLQSGVEKANMEHAKARSEMEGAIKGKEAGRELYAGKKTRVEQLHKKELASSSEMEEADANWKVAETQLQEAQENKKLAQLEYKRAEEIVKRLTIVSPVNGVVVDRFLSQGEYVREQPVVKIAELDPLNIEVVIPAAEYHRIKLGMKATVVPEAPFTGRYTATVRVIDRVIDGASGTFGVRLEMPNPRFRLLAGLKCRVTFPDK